MIKSKVLFVHVPKTAGTSFRIAMKDVLTKKQICHDYAIKGCMTSPVVKRFLLNQINTQQFENRIFKRGVMYFGGHFPLLRYHDLLNDFKRVTFIREPLQQAYSEYSHRRNRGDFDISFSDYIDNPANQLRLKKIFNSYVNLRNMDFVGFTEYYAESIREFNKNYGYNIKVIEENMAKKSVKDRYLISEVIKNRFIELNKEDIEIYHELLNNFKQRNHAAKNYN